MTTRKILNPQTTVCSFNCSFKKKKLQETVERPSAKIHHYITAKRHAIHVPQLRLLLLKGSFSNLWKKKTLSSNLLKILIFFSLVPRPANQASSPPCWNIVPNIVARPRITQGTTPCYDRQVIQVLRAHHFSKGLAGSTQSKQWWIELLYWYKTSRITVLNIRKLSNNCPTTVQLYPPLFTLSWARWFLRKIMRAHNTWKLVYYRNSWTYCEPPNGVLLIARCGFEWNPK